MLGRDFRKTWFWEDPWAELITQKYTPFNLLCLNRNIKKKKSQLVSAFLRLSLMTH